MNENISIFDTQRIAKKSIVKIVAYFRTHCFIYLFGRSLGLNYGIETTTTRVSSNRSFQTLISYQTIFEKLLEEKRANCKNA